MRELLGVSEFLISFYTQPELIRDMMDSLTDFWLGLYGIISKDIQIDMVHMWEDMTGKTGSMLSPAMVSELRIKSILKGTGYIPSFDHQIPPEVGYKEFRYLIGRLKEEMF